MKQLSQAAARKEAKDAAAKAKAKKEEEESKRRKMGTRALQVKLYTSLFFHSCVSTVTHELNQSISLC